MRYINGLAIALAGLLLLTGCGGSGGGSSAALTPGSVSSTQSSTGALSMSVTVPRVRTAASNTPGPTVSIQVTSQSTSQVLASTTVTLNASGPTSTSFSALPLGPATVLVQEITSQSVVIATASGQTTIQPGLNNIALTLALNDQYVYVSNTEDETVTAFKLDPVQQSLTQVGSPLAVPGARTMVPDRSGHFLFVMDLLDNEIHVLSVNPSTGALILLPLTVGTPGQNDAFPVVTNDNRYLYVAGESTNNAGAFNPVGFAGGGAPGNTALSVVYGFAINGLTGALSPVPGSPYFVAGNGEQPVTMDPTGHFIYMSTTVQGQTAVQQVCTSFAIQGNGSLVAISGGQAALPELLPPAPATLATASNEWVSPLVNPANNLAYFQSAIAPFTFQVLPVLSNGAFGTPVGGGPLAAAGAATGANLSTLDPTGQFLYSCNDDTNKVDLYTLGSSGLPQLSTSIPCDASPANLVFDPSGQFAVVACHGNSPDFTGMLDLFTQTASSGVLNEVTAVPSGGRTDDVVFVPVGPPGVAPTVPAPTVLPAGTLTFIGAAPGGEGVVVTPNGHFLYTSTLPGVGGAASFAVGGDVLQGFAIEADGTLNLSPTAVIPDASFLYGVTMDPQGQFLYTSDPQSIRAYAIQGDGSLSEVAGSPQAVPGTGIVTTDTTGTFLYAITDVIGTGTNSFGYGGSGINNVTVLHMDRATQTLSSLPPPVTTGNVPDNLVVSPSNGVLDVAADGVVSVLSLADPSAPAPGFTDPVANLFSGLAYTPNGQFLYTTQSSPSGTSTITGFSVGGDGSLTALSQGAVTTGEFPAGLAVDPSGRFLAVSNNAASTVSMYLIGSGGNLTPVAGSPFFTGSIPGFMTFDPSGTHLYVSTCGSPSLSIYAVSPGP